MQTRERRPVVSGAPPETRRRQAASPAQDSATDRPGRAVACGLGHAATPTAFIGPSDRQLAARRAEPGPMAARPFDPVAAHRWVRAG